jgi:hypothetical protein
VLSTARAADSLLPLAGFPGRLRKQPLFNLHRGFSMSKLLTALVAAVFAVVTVTPVAIAAEKKDEAKKEMKKGEGKKESEGKKGEPKSEPKKEMKKGEGKKAEEKK